MKFQRIGPKIEVQRQNWTENEPKKSRNRGKNGKKLKKKKKQPSLWQNFVKKSRKDYIFKAKTWAKKT